MPKFSSAEDLNESSANTNHIMATAAQKTLAIPELLELILLEIPTRELILSQRVNRIFKTTIRNSTKIQQKFFLKLKPKRPDGRVALNPFLLHVLHHEGIRGHIQTYQYGREVVGSYSDYLRNHANNIIGASGGIVVIVDSVDYTILTKTARGGWWTNMMIADSEINIEVRHWDGRHSSLSTNTLRSLVEACRSLATGGLR